MEHGSLRRLAQLVVLLSVSGICASCVLPLSLHYYVPSAEGAAVRSTSCSGDPPYMVTIFGAVSPQLHIMVSLAQRSLTGIHDPTLTVIIAPDSSERIIVDPTLVRVVADGRLVQPISVRYYVGKSGAAPALESHGPIDIKTDYLIIDLPLGISGALGVVTHLPPITVGGDANQFQDVSFKLEKHTKLVMIAGNC
jgi:hypothetical protein